MHDSTVQVHHRPDVASPLVGAGPRSCGAVRGRAPGGSTSRRLADPPIGTTSGCHDPPGCSRRTVSGRRVLALVLRGQLPGSLDHRRRVSGARSRHGRRRFDTPSNRGVRAVHLSLHFTGEDGLRYTVRSLDKYPTRRLDDELKNSLVSEVLHDLISTLPPTAALVVDPLMRAVARMRRGSAPGNARIRLCRSLPLLLDRDSDAASRRARRGRRRTCTECAI